MPIRCNKSQLGSNLSFRGFKFFKVNGWGYNEDSVKQIYPDLMKMVAIKQSMQNRLGDYHSLVDTKENMHYFIFVQLQVQDLKQLRVYRSNTF